jgi:uncharacterized protein (TIGR00290 family)
MVELQGAAWSKPVRRVPVPASDAERETIALRDALAGGRGPVSVGAIGSSFQWARVLRAADASARRVYAPLWRVAPGKVVREELAAGLDVRIAQVAAEGLSPEWLGQRLTPTLLEEVERRSAAGPALNPAGEGGEYETLVVDAPFFSSRLIIDEADTIARGPLVQWSVRLAHLEPKGFPFDRCLASG